MTGRPRPGSLEEHEEAIGSLEQVTGDLLERVKELEKQLATLISRERDQEEPLR